MRFALWNSFLLLLCGADVPVALDKLPQSVIHAVKAKYPKAEMLQAAKATEDGESFYRVTIKQDTQTLQASFTSRGKLLETNRKLEIKEVSKLAVIALRKHYPGAKLEEAREKIVDPGKANKRTFSVRLTTPTSKKYEVTLDSKGNILEEKDLKGVDKP